MNVEPAPTRSPLWSPLAPASPGIEPEEPYWRPRGPLALELYDLRSSCDYLIGKVFEVLKDDGDPIYDEDPEYDAVVAREVEPVWDYFAWMALGGLPALDEAFEKLLEEIKTLDAERQAQKPNYQLTSAFDYVDALLRLAPHLADGPLIEGSQGKLLHNEDAILNTPLRQVLTVMFPYWTLGASQTTPRDVTCEGLVEGLRAEQPELRIEASWTWKKLRRALVNETERLRFEKAWRDHRRDHRFFVACVVDGVRHSVRRSGRVTLFCGADITGMPPQPPRRAPWIARRGPKSVAELAADFTTLLGVIDPAERDITVTTIYRRVSLPQALSSQDPVNAWHQRIERAMEKLGVATPIDSRKKNGLGPWQRVLKSDPDAQVDLLRVVALAYTGDPKASHRERKAAVEAAVEDWTKDNKRSMERGV